MSKVSQVLASGTTIRQDFRDSVRFVMFETGVEGWEYATHGGTAFVVRCCGTHYGITCRHVFGDFNWRQLALTDRKFGANVAGLRSISYPSSPVGGADGSDICDLGIIQFSSDVGISFFGDDAYVFEPGTVTTSRAGDLLQVNGALKDESTIDDISITPTFALLDFVDRGVTSGDITLREANAQFAKPPFQRLTGLSGSPVFNITAGKLCGVVVRGVLSGERATIHYIDIADVGHALAAVADGTFRADYGKEIVVPWTSPGSIPR